jgi:16S rRNA processing protein RimM
MEPTYLILGQIIQTRGLQGEVKVFLQTDFPLIRFKKANVVYYQTPEGMTPLKVASFNFIGDLGLLKFVGYPTIESVTPLIKQTLYGIKEAITLKKNHFFHDDLLGCTVTNTDQQIIGQVHKVENYAGRTVLRIKRETHKDVLVPFLDVFIRDVNLVTKTITIVFLEGML